MIPILSRGRFSCSCQFVVRCQRAYHELSFSKQGEPSAVLDYYQSSQTGPEAKHQIGDDGGGGGLVHVKMIHALWNPADQNTIQGKYPSPQRDPPTQPPSVRGEEWQVAGSEGWGRVIETSNSSGDGGYSKLTPGTFVTTGQSGMGTLRSSLWLPSQSLIPILRGQELLESQGAAASSLFQLGGTAWRMLHDFESLSKDSNCVIVQNAGNSGVGWMISQLAAIYKIQVISLVRRGSKSQTEFECMVDALTQLHTNTTHVVAEEDLMEDKEALRALQDALSERRPPRLAINAVGGPSAGLLLKMLAPGGTMVTYGGMSMEPVTVATPQLIFKDLRVRGYWHSRWMAQNFSHEKERMIEELVKAVLDHGVQCPPVEIFPLSQMQDALQFESQQSTEAIRKKVVLDCREERSN